MKNKKDECLDEKVKACWVTGRYAHEFMSGGVICRYDKPCPYQREGTYQKECEKHDY
jgi:hypothetical protein